ncbi:MAG: hypothetical protein EXR66_09895 [Dehalococcoidia bacterium]|nr:hypothetical protein [Dehalococcoidia bacterium]
MVAFERPRRTAIDIQGGWPATIGDHDYNRAIVMSGGSIYGLEAQAGGGAELTAMAPVSAPEDPTSRFQPVSGAIIYDFGPTRRDASVYPDYFLGRTAAGALRDGCSPSGPAVARNARVSARFSSTAARAPHPARSGA